MTVFPPGGGLHLPRNKTMLESRLPGEISATSDMQMIPL